VALAELLAPLRERQSSPARLDRTTKRQTVRHSPPCRKANTRALDPTSRYWAMIRGVGARAQTLELDEQESTPPSVLTFKLHDLKEIMQWDKEPT
jgi:hypothetical protein